MRLSLAIGVVTVSLAGCGQAEQQRRSPRARRAGYPEGEPLGDRLVRDGEVLAGGWLAGTVTGCSSPESG